MSQDIVLKMGAGAVAWLTVGTLLTLGISRWLRYQREHDRRDEIARWRAQEREKWREHKVLVRGVEPHG